MLHSFLEWGSSFKRCLSLSDNVITEVLIAVLIEQHVLPHSPHYFQEKWGLKKSY